MTASDAPLPGEDVTRAPCGVQVVERYKGTVRVTREWVIDDADFEVTTGGNFRFDGPCNFEALFARCTEENCKSTSVETLEDRT